MEDDDFEPPLHDFGNYFYPAPNQGVCAQVDKIGPLKSNVYGDIEIQACSQCGGYRIYMMLGNQRIAVNEPTVEEYEPDLHRRIMEYLGWNDKER